MKKTTKKFDYIVDLTKIEHLSDIAPTFALAKHSAHLPLTDEELTDICIAVLDEFRPKVTVAYVCECKCNQKKPNIFKRFWNWLRGKKN